MAASAQESVRSSYPQIFERLTSPDFGGYRPDVGEVKAEKRTDKIGASTVAYTVYYLKVRSKTPGGASVWLELPFKKPSDYPGTLAGIKTARKLEEAQDKALSWSKTWKDAFVRVQADAMAEWMAKQDASMADILEDAEARREAEAAAAEQAEVERRQAQKRATLSNPSTRRVFFEQWGERVAAKLRGPAGRARPTADQIRAVARAGLPPAQAKAAADAAAQLEAAGVDPETAVDVAVGAVQDPAGLPDDVLNIVFPLPDDPAVVVDAIRAGDVNVYNFFMQAAARGIL